MDAIRSNHANEHKHEGFSSVNTELLSTSSNCECRLGSLLLPEILLEACFIELL